MWVLKLVSEASNSAPHSQKGPSSTNLHLPSKRSIQIGITSWWFSKGNLQDSPYFRVGTILSFNLSPFSIFIRILRIWWSDLTSSDRQLPAEKKAHSAATSGCICSWQVSDKKVMPIWAFCGMWPGGNMEYPERILSQTGKNTSKI